MEQSSPQIPSEARAPSKTSLTTRLMNVFAAPGEVFDEVKVSEPRHVNWLMPVLLGCLVGLTYVFVVFSQESIVRSMREAQEQAMQKKVDAGKMTKEQAEQASQMMEKFMGPTMMKLFGSIGAVVSSFAMVFLVALIVWLLGSKAFKGRFRYVKALEVTGLAGMINVLGGLIGMLIAVVFGNMAMTAGPVLLVREFDPASKLHVLLSQLNVVTLWYVAVLAIGVSRLSGVSFAKAAAWLYGIWAAVTLAFTLPGWGR